jgi:type II secretory pathway component PulF
MKFNYQARSETGKVQSGVVEASDREAAFDVLRTHGLYVTALEEITSVPVYARKLRIFERVTKKDIVLFSRQVSIMFKSKVPVVETLQTVARQSRKPVLKEKILKIAGKVEGGTTLSESLSLYPKIFTPFYINMVKSGEASGKLSDVFLYLADYLEREHSFQGKIRGALIYPLFILIVFLAVFVIMMVYVIPQLAEVLKETERELPLITRSVIAISDFLKSRGIIAALVFLGLIIAFVQFVKSKAGKKFFDKNLLRLPMLGAFLKRLYLARCALNLSTLISGGLPIAQALEISAEVVGNGIYRKVILKTRDEVKKGESISSVLEKYPNLIFPLFYQMVTVGEKTGTLDSSLMNVVEFYQKDVDRTLDNFIKLLEPIFIIFLGGVVAGLMGAVLMPLYSIGIV